MLSIEAHIEPRKLGPRADSNPSSTLTVSARIGKLVWFACGEQSTPQVHMKAGALMEVGANPLTDSGLPTEDPSVPGRQTANSMRVLCPQEVNRFGNQRRCNCEVQLRPHVGVIDGGLKNFDHMHTVQREGARLKTSLHLLRQFANVVSDWGHSDNLRVLDGGGRCGLSVTTRSAPSLQSGYGGSAKAGFPRRVSPGNNRPASKQWTRALFEKAGSVNGGIFLLLAALDSDDVRCA